MHTCPCLQFRSILEPCLLGNGVCGNDASQAAATASANRLPTLHATAVNEGRLEKKRDHCLWFELVMMFCAAMKVLRSVVQREEGPQQVLARDRQENIHECALRQKPRCIVRAREADLVFPSHKLAGARPALWWLRQPWVMAAVGCSAEAPREADGTSLVLVACGTVGDVQPLWEYACSSTHATVGFVCPGVLAGAAVRQRWLAAAFHESFPICADLLAPCAPPHVQVLPLSISCFVSCDDESASRPSKRPRTNACSQTDVGLAPAKASQRASLRLAPTDLQLLLSKCCPTPPLCPPQLVLFNLFALEAWLVACAVQVPAVLLTPYPPWQDRPPGVLEALKHDAPVTWATLNHPPSEACLDLATVGHVAWPLLCPVRWAELHDALQASAGGRRLSTVFQRRSTMPSLRVLYACAHALLPHQGFWPKNVSVVGSPGSSWWPTQQGDELPAEAVLSALIPSPDLLLVSLATIDSMGLLVDAHALLQCLAALENVAVWVQGSLTGQVWQVWKQGQPSDFDGSAGPAAYLQQLHQGPARRLLVTPYPTPHADVYACARARGMRVTHLHHAGCGTSQTCLAHAVPSLACPFRFDQPDRAAQLAYIGAGVHISPTALAQPQPCGEDSSTESGDEASSTAASALRKLRMCSSAQVLRRALVRCRRLGTNLHRLRAQVLAEAETFALNVTSACSQVLECHRRISLSPEELQWPSAQGLPGVCCHSITLWGTAGGEAPSLGLSWGVPLATTKRSIRFLSNCPAEAALFVREIWQDAVYRPALERCSQAQATILLDVGANIGLASLAALSGPSAVHFVVAFEPSPSAQALFLDNMHVNGIRCEVVQSAEDLSQAVARAESARHPAVVLCTVALSALLAPEVPQHASFVEFPGLLGHSSLLCAFDPRSSAEGLARQHRRKLCKSNVIPHVSVWDAGHTLHLTLAALKGPCAVNVKVDVERHELEVLRSFTRAPVASAVRTIAAEVHSSNLSAAKQVLVDSGLRVSGQSILGGAGDAQVLLASR